MAWTLLSHFSRPWMNPFRVASHLKVSSDLRTLVHRIMSLLASIHLSKNTFFVVDCRKIPSMISGIIPLFPEII
jgi:hypothetical protein